MLYIQSKAGLQQFWNRIQLWQMHLLEIEKSKFNAGSLQTAVA